MNSTARAKPDTEGRWALGVDIGGNSLKMGLIGIDGKLDSISPIPTPSGSDAVDRIVEQVETIGRSLLDRAEGEVGAVGVVAPGIIDSERGVAVTAANMPWNDDRLAERIEQALGLPSFLGHDVRAAAVAEAVWGAARNVDDFLLIALGTGVGAAGFRRNASARQDQNLVGELGHTSVAFDGPRCPCGRLGCLEVFASGKGLGARYGDRTGTGLGLDGLDVQRRLQEGDPDAAAVWDDAASALTAGILNCLVLLEFSPELILIAGGVADAGPVLLNPVLAAMRAAYPRFLTEQQRYRQGRRAEVRISAYGRRSGLAGAGALAWIRLGFSPQMLWKARGA